MLKPELSSSLLSARCNYVVILRAQV
jgi:hypothetical protein